jgi:acetyl-CoA carboxylase carboxyltransferase component
VEGLERGFDGEAAGDLAAFLAANAVGKESDAATRATVIEGIGLVKGDEVFVFSPDQSGN